MRVAIAAVLVSAAGLAQTTQPAPPPKLAVVIVVDQMRADYPARFQRDWTGGLKRLVTDGAVFDNAAYPYLTTVTCAGHATIATGVFTNTHGIVHNTWWDRDSGAVTTCTRDPRANNLGVNGQTAGGDSGTLLKRSTFADAIRERGGHVVTIALKDRSAIMLAGHGGDAVVWLNESTGAWTTSTAFAKEMPEAVRRIAASRPIAADAGKVWERSLAPDQYAGPDDAAGEAPPPGWTRTFPHAIAAAPAEGPNDPTFVAQWERTPFADAAVAGFAADLVDAFALGRHDHTDVLGVSFATPDIVGHGYGPDSQEIQDIYYRLDRSIGALFDRLDATVGRGAWVAVLAADHGVTPLPERLAATGKPSGRLSGAAVTAAIDAELKGRLGPGPFVAAAGTNDIYFRKGAFDALRAQPELLDAVVRRLEGMQGVDRVFVGEQLRNDAKNKDRLRRAAALSYYPGRSGDLVLALKPGFMITTNGTTHGSAVDDDQRVPLVLYGARVKAGHYPDAVTPADIAPTLAALAGVAMPNVEGKVLSQAIER